MVLLFSFQRSTLLFVASLMPLVGRHHGFRRSAGERGVVTCVMLMVIRVLGAMGAALGAAQMQLLLLCYLEIGLGFNVRAQVSLKCEPWQL